MFERSSLNYSILLQHVCISQNKRSLTGSTSQVFSCSLNKIYSIKDTTATTSPGKAISSVQPRLGEETLKAFRLQNFPVLHPQPRAI